MKYVAVGLIGVVLTGCSGQASRERFAPMPVAGAHGEKGAPRIAYDSIGRGSAAVVFVHGWTCDRTFWSRQVPALRGKHRLILIDLPGHGDSDAPEEADYSIPFFADSVVAVMKDAGVRRAVLVGHSLGFSISREVARRYPERVTALVSCDGSPLRPPTSDAPEDVEAWRERIQAFIDRVTQPEPRAARMAFVETMFHERTPAEVRLEVLSKSARAPDHVAVRSIGGLNDLSLWRTEPMPLPMLAILARNEHTPADREEQWRRWFPRVEYHEWSDVGHFPMMEKPEEFNALLIDFLERLPEQP